MFEYFILWLRIKLHIALQNLRKRQKNSPLKAEIRSGLKRILENISAEKIKAKKGLKDLKTTCIALIRIYLSFKIKIEKKIFIKIKNTFLIIYQFP